MPKLVGKFVEVKGPEIRGRNLTTNFILHLSNLHSFGLLKAEELEKCVLMLYQQEDTGNLKLRGK